MQHALKFFVLVVASSTSVCRAHWKLTVPMPRSGSAYENDPLGNPVTCRNSRRNPSIPRPTYAAGEYMEIEFGAPNAPFGHVGDCSLYISYDANAAQFVKIANLPDCRSQINTRVPILLPHELPGGDAILRWDQYALHQGNFIEWYVQCADIAVTASRSARDWGSFNKFSIPAVYPSSIREYRRSTAVPGDGDFYMTGPACVDECINQCSLTAEGTVGYTGYGGEEGQVPCGTEQPAPMPSPYPVPVPSPPPTPPSVVTCEPIGNCDAYSWCTQASYVEWCKSQDVCPSPFCKTASSAPTPTPMPAPVPMPSPTPAPVPMPTPNPSNGRRCVATLEGFYNDAAVYGPICQAQEQENVCTALPMCRWEEASLAQSSLRRHRFLGQALIQSRADVKDNILLTANEEM